MNLPKKDQKQADEKLSCSIQSMARVRFQANSRDNKANSYIEQLSPTALAYLGDVVYELYVRTYYLLPPKKIVDYHNQVVNKVRAEAQADCLQILTPYLTGAEKEMLRRGRNAAGGKPRRLSPKIYQQATSLETLIGYLYLTNPRRLDELLGKLNFSLLSNK
ncbi:MAG: ribonuclease III domain-containing protein [Xenococcaceae cyanobacterium MO_188.B32]|nr:ribonuclease III domain-containing protein [Xenococcaceae cyanobacterium MO_188.B32]